MNIQKILHHALFVAAVSGSCATADAQISTVREPGDLRAAGKVDFPISGARAVRPEFDRGVALLHSFFYEEARRIFTAVGPKRIRRVTAPMGRRHDLVAPDLDTSDR